MDLPPLSYEEDFIHKEERSRLLEAISQLPFLRSKHFLYGRNVNSSVKYCWISDTKLPYTFGRTMTNELPAHSFFDFPELNFIRNLVEEKTGRNFNSVLVNMYPDGETSLGAHSDDDVWLGKSFIVPSISFGATRFFDVTPKARPVGETSRKRTSKGKMVGELDSAPAYILHTSSSSSTSESSYAKPFLSTEGKHRYILRSGSLVIMGEGMQEHWYHSIPKQVKAIDDDGTRLRINTGVRFNLTFRDVIPDLFSKMPKKK